MTSKNTKAASFAELSGDRRMVKLGSFNFSEPTTSAGDLQVARLTRRFVLSLPLAAVVASIAYGEGAR